MIYTYLKQGLNTKVISTTYDITTLGGYENSVGTTWQDYLSGKYILLNAEQLAFYQEHPEATPEEIYNAQLTPVPARTLDDAKKELHIKADDMAEELKVFYVDNMVTWFSDRPSVNLQIDAEAFEGTEYIDLYDDNDNHIHLPLAEAKNMILAVERYDNRCKIFIRNLHSMIETIPTLEVADSIDVEEYRAQAPETPSFYTEPQPTAETYYIYYKILNAHADNDVSAVTAGDAWKSTVYPDDGFALLRTDFTAEMGSKPIDVYFEPDVLGRKEYASWARMEIPSVTGDISIVTIGRNE